MESRLATKKRLVRILEKLATAYPDARLELDYESPLQLMIALILAAQCTDKKVNEISPGLFRKYPTARHFASAPEGELEEAIFATGFYRQKAKSIRACCSVLVEKFGGNVPADLHQLLALPGVGRKTANILLGNAFGVPGIGVDTHVLRLSQRLGFTRAESPDEVEADLVQVVPRQDQIRFCHLIQWHGRRTCFARKPDCPKCIAAELCPYPDKTLPPKEKVSKTGSRWIADPELKSKGSARRSKSKKVDLFA